MAPMTGNTKLGVATAPRAIAARRGSFQNYAANSGGTLGGTVDAAGAQADRSAYLGARGLTAYDANQTGLLAAQQARTPIGIAGNGYIYAGDVGKTIGAYGGYGGTYIAAPGTTINARTAGGGSAVARSPGGAGYGGYGGAAGGGFNALRGASLGGGSYGSGSGGANAGGIPAALQAAQDAANAENQARYEQGLTRIQTGGADQLAQLASGYQGLSGMVGSLSNVDETRAKRTTDQELASQTARLYGMGLANTTGAVMARQGIIDRGSQREQAAGDENTRLAIQLGQAQIGQTQSALAGTRGEETNWIANKVTNGPNAAQWSQLLSQAGANGGGYPGYGGGGGNAGGFTLDNGGAPGGTQETQWHSTLPTTAQNNANPKNFLPGGAYNSSGGAGFGGYGGNVLPPADLTGEVAGGFGTSGAGGGGFGGGGPGDYQPAPNPVANTSGQADPWAPWLPGMSNSKFDPSIGAYRHWDADSQTWVAG
jgi:hypothetical protein